MLSALGMRDPFDAARADFSGMDGRPHWLFLSGVIHKAFVDVDETGTEAAAATAVGVPFGRPSPRQTMPPTFHADHPFLVVIRERSSGAVLFLGRVANPAR
jgi:serpin B